APNTPTCAQNMTAAAYSPTYDSANPLTNLIGQGGVSTGTTAPFGQPRFTAEVAAGAPVVLVVATVDTTLPATLCTYTVNASVPVLGKCAMDVDGDGSVVATKDGLIAARAMLGLTGAAVTNGISFSGAATRTDWTSIRRYLVNQCGMTLAP
ncbi:MAG TPA: hypothetical protein PKN64_16930, partial [Casimicrobium sp.]|nr:hypothetical protein [Casimicrobium sp.]